ncbi:MAG TPA: thioredoxin-like domain-containing protein [Lacipirellulaceae bacterium]|jgi:DNA-binding beta-propeller fold protein YncE|nr:thioredoxin-like domain-containing protein [Lacipirellulaceae bacterium]
MSIGYPVHCEWHADRRHGMRQVLVVRTIVLLSVFGTTLAVTKSVLAETKTAANDAVADPYPRRVPAPQLDGGEWVNVAKPITLPELRGRFVLLDFWTFCCINCMHVLPELKKLEHAFPNELAIIGVHSAKFEGEHVTENIRQAVLRYEIEHPIVNDSQMTIWNRYGARSWPTLVLIDPTGEVVWAASGERTFEEIRSVIDRGLPFYKSQGLLKPGRRPELIGEGKRLAAEPLKFPGKILADAASDRLFVADSNHNRIVIATLSGKLQEVVGSGAIGHADGGFEACSFNHPQGMALVENGLFVADTENHLLRKVDLVRKQVITIAGNGEKGSAWADVLGNEDAAADRRPATPSNKLLSLSLSSPWALWHHDHDLFIAMAGMQQIWKMRLDGSKLAAFAGNGRENIVDGPLLPKQPYQEGFASFAQPSGLTSDGKQLFVADSEGSTVRAVPFDPNGEVRTLVGLTSTLFDFGDKDGTGQEVRLQHPLGVAWADGQLYVADTYNNKIKAIDVAKKSCRTVAGNGRAGLADADKGLDASFNEPAGISATNGRLYVADTNNHRVRIVELAPPNRVTTLQIDGLAPPAMK